MKYDILIYLVVIAVTVHLIEKLYPLIKIIKEWNIKRKKAAVEAERRRGHDERLDYISNMGYQLNFIDAKFEKGEDYIYERALSYLPKLATNKWFELYKNKIA